MPLLLCPRLLQAIATGMAIAHATPARTIPVTMTLVIVLCSPEELEVFVVLTAAGFTPVDVKVIFGLAPVVQVKLKTREE